MLREGFDEGLALEGVPPSLVASLCLLERFKPEGCQKKMDVWHTLMSVWIAPPKENIAVARQYTGKQPRNSEFLCTTTAVCMHFICKYRVVDGDV